MKKIVQIFIVLITFSNLTFGQEVQKSNLLNYTPSKLLKNKQMDFKIFDNLYSFLRESILIYNLKII